MLQQKCNTRSRNIFKLRSTTNIKNKGSLANSRERKKREEKRRKGKKGKRIEFRLSSHQREMRA